MTTHDNMAESHSRDRGRRRRRGGGLLQALLALVVLALGAVVLVAFIKFRKSPEQIEQEVVAPLVRVRTLQAQDVPMTVQGYGEVSPKVRVDIIPEVSGKVVFIHSELRSGGIVPANEKIVQIDSRDYELAVRQAAATVAEAQVRLDTEVAEAEVARREWRQLHPETEPTSPLVFREPQIGRARAGLESAEAQLATAELRLERTAIYLPFDVLIANESVDLGQYVGVGQPLATAYGIEAFEIEVPLEDEDLAWFDVAQTSISLRDAAGERRVQADVQAEFGDQTHLWNGYVTRMTGQVDRMSRMVPVVVEVRKPLDGAGERPPLLPGAFVKVLIGGRTLENAMAVPRDAIHGEDRVWLVNEGRLHIVSLDIVRTDGAFAYVTGGIPDGAAIIVSALDSPVDGMAVRVPEAATEEESTDAGGGSSDSKGRE